VTVGPEEHKLGLRGSSTTGLQLDGVDLPTDRLLVYWNLRSPRVAVHPDCVAACQAAARALADLGHRVEPVAELAFGPEEGFAGIVDVPRRARRRVQPRGAGAVLPRCRALRPSPTALRGAG